jgi:hypothetical protein
LLSPCFQSKRVHLFIFLHDAYDILNVFAFDQKRMLKPDLQQWQPPYRACKSGEI